MIIVLKLLVTTELRFDVCGRGDSLIGTSIVYGLLIHLVWLRMVTVEFII